MTTQPVPPSEEIIDPEVPIIDAHQHLFVRPNMRYLADDLKADLACGHTFVATVYVEAKGYPRPDGPEHLRSIGELEFANGVGAMGRAGYFDGTLACDGIVANANLRLGEAAVDELLDRMIACAPDRLCGIRQIAVWHENPAAFTSPLARPPEGMLGEAAFRAGFARLAARGLPFDVALYYGQFGDLLALADAFPDTKLILNHMGQVYGLGESEETRTALRQDWASRLPEVAARPNVYCKVGGLGMPSWGFGFEEQGGHASSEELARAWAPYVETAIAAFGPNRCMFQSNFPIDRVTAPYATLWNAYKRIVKGCSDEERTALFMQTALDAYALKLGSS